VFQDSLDTKACWGYEEDCKAENSFSVPYCPGDHKGWVATKRAQLDTYYAQGDFGYVRDQRKEMMLLCEPLFIVSFNCNMNVTLYTENKKIITRYLDRIPLCSG